MKRDRNVDWRKTVFARDRTIEALTKERNALEVERDALKAKGGGRP